MISGIKPGGKRNYDDKKQAELIERIKSSAAFRSGDLVALGSDEPDRPMPKARVPNIAHAKEPLALQMINEETNVQTLSEWWAFENERGEDLGGPRPTVLEAIGERGKAMSSSPGERNA